MEQLKVKKKEIIILNVIIFLALSYLFLYLQYAYRHHLSPFSTVYLRKSLELFWYVVLPIVTTMWLTFRHHRQATGWYALSILLISLKVVEGLFIEFNKIIVVALFFYSVISYFLYQLLNAYYQLAALNPNYGKDDLFEPLLRRIDCQLELNNNIRAGILTNWDDEGCFVQLPEAAKLPRRISIRIFLHSREFIQQGEVVAQTMDARGFGIKFSPSPKSLNVFNWSEFIELVHELGFVPERLR